MLSEEQKKEIIKRIKEKGERHTQIVNFLCYPDKPDFGAGKTAEDIWLENKDRLQTTDQLYVVLRWVAW